MMPIRVRKNQYRGVNAHLHSYFQAEGGWKGFHTSQVATMAFALNAQLIDMGYHATIKSSLQIRDSGGRWRRPTADIAIREHDVDAPRSSGTMQAPDGAVTLTIPDMLNLALDPTETYDAIGIYPLDDDTAPAAWIELLSPSNKPGAGSSAAQYHDKRELLIKNGVTYVEIDYLHETRPTVQLPDYIRGEVDASPYRILVFIPWPDLWEGRTDLYAFAVDDPIPTVALPLRDADLLHFDFNTPYQQEFAAMVYGLGRIDYTELPHNFERYSIADQGRIAARMLAIKQAVERGDDLESGPFDVPEVTLESALKQLGR